MWVRHDVLASPARLATRGRVAEAPPGVAPPPGRCGPHRLVAGCAGLCERARKKGGQKTGPNPTDKGKPGSKRHVVVDAQGIPLAVLLSAANTHDSMLFEALLEAIEPIKRPRGRPRKRPEKLHADKGYDYAKCRRYLRRYGIKSRIARRGIESSERLGPHRWVVERTQAWYNRFRRLAVRYERRDDIHEAFLSLGSALICLGFLERGF